MNIYPKILILTILLLFQFSLIVSAQKRVRGAAREPYASLSVTEKLEVQKKLIVKLKSDTDFVALEKIIKHYNLDNNSNFKNRSSKKNGLNGQSKELRESKVEAVSRTIKLMNKYPEFGQLDSETRKDVIKEARTKIDSKTTNI
ncbi:hypothetical protein [Pedobacter helvus]|uniref:Uncharacterized protein n=1 Tax=Pedobacter helvus TaxID=2563444 RepID=A0ABW9JD64_9SPHI|nr:hypothetical protein [Pedobacter ureilyticus]